MKEILEKKFNSLSPSEKIKTLKKWRTIEKMVINALCDVMDKVAGNKDLNEYDLPLVFTEMAHKSILFLGGYLEKTFSLKKRDKEKMRFQINLQFESIINEIKNAKEDKKMKKLLALSLILSLSACVIPNCGTSRVDKATFDRCIDTAMMVPGRMGIIPPAEIDACSAKAAQVTKQMCGM